MVRTVIPLEESARDAGEWRRRRALDPPCSNSIKYHSSVLPASSGELVPSPARPSPTSLEHSDQVLGWGRVLSHSQGRLGQAAIPNPIEIP